jgi:hypothetical protein
MIYTVECNFSDPNTEEQWNNFYSLNKLPALISVTGIHTSQRFKALGFGYPIYLAVHSIDSAEVLAGEEYHKKGGGNFAQWQEYITDWRRNLYKGINQAPAIGADEYLLLSTKGPESFIKIGLIPQEIQAVALDKSPAYRWLAKIDGANSHLLEYLPKDIYLYAPIAEQLVSAS